MSKHEIIVHCLGYEFGYRGRLEFKKSVVTGCAGAFVAGQSQARNGAELGKVLAHLVFIETMGDTADGRGVPVSFWGEESRVRKGR